MKQFLKNNATSLMIAGLILVFVLLFALTLQRYLPTFGQADLNEAPSVYKEHLIYYNNLDRKKQFLYDALVNAIDEYDEITEEIRYTYTSADFNDVVERIIADHPEYFFVNFEGLESYVSETHTKVRISYQDEITKVKELRTNLDDKVNEILSAISDDMTDFETELYLHDYLVENCKYLTDANNKGYTASTAYGALCEGTAICDGYAHAFKLLMNRAGLYCCVVDGYIDDIPHMWNMVKIDGDFYHVDVTWDDSDDLDNLSMDYYLYLNVSTDRISLDHSIRDAEMLPLAERENDYYDTLGLCAKDSDSLRSIIHESLLEAARVGREYIVFKTVYDCSDEAISETLRDTIELINAEGDASFNELFQQLKRIDLREQERIYFYKIYTR